MKETSISDKQAKLINEFFVSVNKDCDQPLLLKDFVSKLVPDEKVQLYEIGRYSTDGLSTVVLFTGRVEDIDLNKFGHRNVSKIYMLKNSKKYMQIRLT